MSRLTDDDIRAIWQVLPLDQEPTVENLNNYVKQVIQNLKDHYNNIVRVEITPLENEITTLQDDLATFTLQFRNVMDRYLTLSTRNVHISGSADKYYELRNPKGIENIL